MAEVTDPRQRTVAAVFKSIQDNAKEWRRPYLGPSVLGRPCERHLWLLFRWASKPAHSGRLLALFERGDREEEVQFRRLEAIGVRISARQAHCHIAPHVVGHVDGVALGLVEAPRSPHVIDIKTASRRSFDKLLKAGAEEWKPEYWAQLQLYMPGMECDRAVLWVVCKDDDRLYMERFRSDPAAAKALLTKAERIIYAPRPLSRISEDPSWFECRFCDHYDICHGGQHERLERNCRTCVSSTPQRDGTWRCDFFNTKLRLEKQWAGCDQQLLIPDLLPSTWRAESVNERKREVRYSDPAGNVWVDSGGRLRNATDRESQGADS